MPLHESGEDYLEAILMLSQQFDKVRSVDIADHLGVTKASVSKAMSGLEAKGYVEMGKRDVRLTEKGMQVAQEMLERHNFFVGLLERAGVDGDVAAKEGCHMEHCLSEDSFLKLQSMLNSENVSAS